MRYEVAVATDALAVKFCPPSKLLPCAMGGRRQVIAVTRGEMIYPVEAGKTDEN